MKEVSGAYTPINSVRESCFPHCSTLTQGCREDGETQEPPGGSVLKTSAPGETVRTLLSPFVPQSTVVVVFRKRGESHKRHRPFLFPGSLHPNCVTKTCDPTLASTAKIEI